MTKQQTIARERKIALLWHTYRMFNIDITFDVLVPVIDRRNGECKVVSLVTLEAWTPNEAYQYCGVNENGQEVIYRYKKIGGWLREV